jgi:hypothetical protein
MKRVTLHPQLLAAFFVGAALILIHARGYDDAVLSAELRPVPPVPVIGDAFMMAPVIRPQRDPFVAAVDEGDSRARGTISDARVESDTPLETGVSSLRLRAVVLGARRYALMSDGKSSNIVTVGSALAGSTVTDISLRGIGLANGARFIPEDNQK